ncbi:MAG: hypothetical protein KatS3mg003_0570 [Candidatus Nitrosocaldaceae archaeon]|nr:MAG: hypothetical protein KatS3mg003_0570 [Candidatus Nitrosocaldaceae archaeon]
MIKRLKVENFGPIASADIEFGDITVIIGPQNSGKSYLATLINISQGWCDLNNGAFLEDHFYFLLQELIRVKKGTGRYNEHEIKDVLRNNIDEFTEELIKESINLEKRGLRNVLPTLLKNYYLVELWDLIYKRSNYASINCYFDGDEITHSVSFKIKENKINVDINVDKINVDKVRIKELELTLRTSRVEGETYHKYESIIIPTERMTLLSLFAQTTTALLDIYQRYGKEFKVKNSLMHYIKHMNILLNEPREYKIFDIGKLTINEKGLIKGIYFNDKKRKIKVPLNSAGSGIMQLAGIVIPIEMLDTKFIIIEEPEINLHADMQLKVAEYLAKVSKTKKLFITTHSELILTKLIHLYKLGKIKELKAYFIDSDKVKPIEIGEAGEYELPKSIAKVLEVLDKEALELSRKIYGSAVYEPNIS